MLEEVHQELERPTPLLFLLQEKGKVCQRYRGDLKDVWEPDCTIVLRDGGADHMGKGAAERCSQERKQVPNE